MNDAIKRSGSIVCASLLSIFFFTVSSNTLSVRAAEATYLLPVSYFNEIATAPSESNEECINTVEVVATLSTDTLQQGTVVTITGIPTDCINFQEDDDYTVVLTEGDSASTTYGGWYDGQDYADGTISYVMQTDASTLSISFGEWRMLDASGMDAYYVINSDGSVVSE